MRPNPTSRKLTAAGFLPSWVLDVLERRRDWVLARAAIREDLGSNAWYDESESAALSAVLEVGSVQRPLAEAIYAAECELHNLRLQRHRYQKSIAIFNMQRKRIIQLKRTLQEHGIPVPKGDRGEC